VISYRRPYNPQGGRLAKDDHEELGNEAADIMSNRRVSQPFVHCVLFLITYVLVWGAFGYGPSSSLTDIFTGVLCCSIFTYIPVACIAALIYLLTHRKSPDDKTVHTDSSSLPLDDLAP
jgi:hypothetical protein